MQNKHKTRLAIHFHTLTQRFHFLTPTTLSTLPRLFIASLLLIMAMSGLVHAAPTHFNNPVIAGFHPDPSVIRVGDDYYLANSSFEWFPGVPIFHSKDLVNWQRIGHAIHRADQLPELAKIENSRGIYAPTLRHHNGTFYLITTCVRCGGNFYVTAKDPAGPWSDPIWVDGNGARGIDPSLFWDDNGKAYYTGTGILDKSQSQWPNQNGIWIAEIDLKTGKLLSPKKQLTLGHAINARWTEGPHIYKIDGKYLLLVAEGGTGFHHAITVFKSDKIEGPYIPHHSNPVMTHRHLGKSHKISTIGHADLVQTPNGDWWAVSLGKRQFNGTQLLARETFLMPVSFEDGWPVFNPGIGKVLETDVRPNLPWTPVPSESGLTSFDEKTLPLAYNFLRPHQNTWHKISRGKLIITGQNATLADKVSLPAFIGRRIQDVTFTVETQLKSKSKAIGAAAGIALYRNNKNFITLMKTQDKIILSHISKGKTIQHDTVSYTGSEVFLKADTNANLETQFYFGKNSNTLKPLGDPQSLHTISDNNAGGFNGPYVGMYVVKGADAQKPVKASFDWFKYTAH